MPCSMAKNNYPNKWSVYFRGNFVTGQHMDLSVAVIYSWLHITLLPVAQPEGPSRSWHHLLFWKSSPGELPGDWGAVWISEYWCRDGVEIQAQVSHLFLTAIWMMDDVHNHATLSWSIQILKNIWKYFIEKK